MQSETRQASENNRGRCEENHRSRRNFRFSRKRSRHLSPAALYVPFIIALIKLQPKRYRANRDKRDSRGIRNDSSAFLRTMGFER